MVKTTKAAGAKFVVSPNDHPGGRGGGSDRDLISADQGGHVVGVCCAAQEPEEGDVEDVRELPCLQTKAVVDGESNQAGAEWLLERLPHAEVRG